MRRRLRRLRLRRRRLRRLRLPPPPPVLLVLLAALREPLAGAIRLKLAICPPPLLFGAVYPVTGILPTLR